MTAADLDMSHGLVAGVWFLAAVVAFIGCVVLVVLPAGPGTKTLLYLAASALLAAAVFALLVAVTV